MSTSHEAKSIRTTTAVRFWRCLLLVLLLPQNSIAASDSDRDGVPDPVEIELGTEPYLFDTDGDGLSDAEEIGADFKKPIDTDGDGKIDALDPDDDNDGVPTILELEQPGAVNRSWPTDPDGDGLKNYLDRDADNDGLTDGKEAGLTGVDDDYDRIDNAFDADFLNKTDENGDGIADQIDLPDSNNNSIPDFLEKNTHIKVARTRADDAGSEKTESSTKEPENKTMDSKSTLSKRGIKAESETGVQNASQIVAAAMPNKKSSDAQKPQIKQPGNAQQTQSKSNDTKAEVTPVVVSEVNVVKSAEVTLEKKESVKPVKALKPAANSPHKSQKITYEFNDILNALDSDHDGLSDSFEVRLGTDPNKRDSDGDKVSDAIEIGLDPNTPQDSDHDQVIDALDNDDDNDGVLTRHEDINKDGSPINDDTDQDGVPNYLDANDDGDDRLTIEESQLRDSDNDGIVDYLDKNDGVKDPQPLVASTNVIPDKPEVVILYENNDAMLSNLDLSADTSASTSTPTPLKPVAVSSNSNTNVAATSKPGKTPTGGTETVLKEANVSPAPSGLTAARTAIKTDAGENRVMATLEKAITEHSRNTAMAPKAGKVLWANAEQPSKVARTNKTDRQLIKKNDSIVPISKHNAPDKKTPEEEKASSGFMAWLTSLWQD